MPRKSKQLSFFQNPSFKYNARTDHGGSTGLGRRKKERPIDPKRALHVVFRSTQAKGEQSMLRPKFERKIKRLLERHSHRAQIKVYHYANVGNHLHVLIKGKSRRKIQKFLRTFPALVARLVTGARKGQAKGRFWDLLAYSRVVDWGRAFFNAKYYVIQNELEALGIWSSRAIQPPRSPPRHPHVQPPRPTPTCLAPHPV